VLLLALALWLALAWPLATGQRTFILRDVMTTHLPLKAFGAAELAAGRIPAINPLWATGQPYRGNPNALPFYPGNLLYLALPFWSAFGIHYVGHWLLAFFGMCRLGRELGQSRQAALVAALAYAGSGYVLTTLTFMNLLTVAAWAPWALAGLARGGRRGTLLAGIACGLMLLGGEPISAALVIPAMAVVAVGAHGWRSGLGTAAAAGGVGLLVALPQLVATARVLPFSVRATLGLPAAQSAAQALHPARLLELVWPLPWGWPSDLGRFAYWAPAVTPQTPYIYSLHAGLVACVLAVLAIRHGARGARAWGLLAVVALFAAWALGLDAGWTSALTGGLFRYPQKLLLPFTLAFALLAGFGVEPALARSRPARLWLATAAAFGAAAVALGAGLARFAEWLRAHLVIEGHAGIARTQAANWWLLALAATAIALLAAWAAARRSAAGLAAAQLVALLPLAPIWVTDATAPYRAPAPLAGALGESPRIAHAGAAFPPWEPAFPLAPAVADPVSQARLARAALEPPFAALDGVEQIVAPDLEGITSPRTAVLHRRLAQADWLLRLRWLRRLGAGWLIRVSPAPGPQLTPVAVEASHGARAELFRLGESPLAWWPQAVVARAGADAAWSAVARGEVADAMAVTEREVAHAAGGAVELVGESPDRLELEIDSGGGLAIVRRAYLPIYRARLADGTRLATQPVDVALLGIEVPPGRQRVIVDVTSWPETLAGVVALVTLAAAGWLAWRRA
jgi:hypothetical protein